MYEIGRVYIWQNQVGEASAYNGTECTVLEAEQWHETPSGELKLGQMVITQCGKIKGAQRGDLRPKNPPTGEQKIRSMFEPKPVMEVA